MCIKYKERKIPAVMTNKENVNKGMNGVAVHCAASRCSERDAAALPALLLGSFWALNHSVLEGLSGATAGSSQ